MSVMEIGKELVGLCRQGENLEAIEKLYHPDVVSVEAFAMPGMEQTQRGIEAIKGKNTWWMENNEVHGGKSAAPLPTATGSRSGLNTTSPANRPSSVRRLKKSASIPLKTARLRKKSFFTVWKDRRACCYPSYEY